MTPVANIMRWKTVNTGDKAASPLSYFDFPKESRMYDLYEFGSAPAESNVILGGGGLFGASERLQSRVQLLMRGRTEGQQIVAWGAGLNRHGRHNLREPEKMPWYFDQFDMHGIRDVLPFKRWVPCVSCMHPAFDDPPEPTHDVVIYEHESYALADVGIAAPRCRARLDSAGDIAKAVEFLASGAIVLTNTYHGAYWSTLLCRKTIVIDPWSTKFLHMKHEPDLATADSWPLHVESAKLHDEALDECRAANRKYYADVMELLA